MKIACLGNMNNLIAPTAQYLAKMGHTVHLFLLYEYDHFHPFADYLNPDDIGFSIKKLEMGFGAVLDIPKTTLKQQLSNYDFYIGTDYAPAILARIGIKLNYFIWAGTDLFEWPFYTSSYMRLQAWEAPLKQIAELQKLGIKNAKAISMSLNNDLILEAIEKTGFKGAIIPPIPFLYYPQLPSLANYKNEYSNLVTQQKQQGKLVLVSQGRQWWKTAPAHLSKGNDVFIHAIHQLVHTHQQNIHVFLFEYGQDVMHSKELIAQLNLEEHITWLPKMLRKELLSVMAQAHIGVGQFGIESWYLYCSNAEIIATCGNYLGNRNDEWLAKQNVELYPMLRANSVEEIVAQLLAFNPDKKQIANQAQQWLKTYDEQNFLNQMKQDLQNAKKQQLSINEQFKVLQLNIKCKLAIAFNSAILATKIVPLRSWLTQLKTA